MTIPVWVEQQNGTFTASVPGVPQLTAQGATREAALAAVGRLVRQRQQTGDLVELDVPVVHPALARPQATEAEREAWREVVDEIYRERDALKAQEFPE